jgi:hypothetical protein
VGVGISSGNSWVYLTSRWLRLRINLVFRSTVCLPFSSAGIIFVGLPLLFSHFGWVCSASGILIAAILVCPVCGKESRARLGPY